MGRTKQWSTLLGNIKIAINSNNKEGMKKAYQIGQIIIEKKVLSIPII